MIHWPIHLGPLADDDFGSMGRILIFVVIFVGWIISALLKKQAEKKEQERSERRARELDEELEENRKAAPPPRLGYGWQAVPAPEEDEEVHSVFEDEPGYEESVVELRPVPVEAPSEESTELHRQKTLRDLIRRRREMAAAQTYVAPSMPAMPAIPAAGLSQTREVKTRVDLSDAKTARAAIVFQEILSAPKALRRSPELWD